MLTEGAFRLALSSLLQRASHLESWTFPKCPSRTFDTSCPLVVQSLSVSHSLTLGIPELGQRFSFYPSFRPTPY